MTGKKFDQEKLDPTLLPPEVEIMIAEILGHGCKKYGRENWKDVPEAEQRYLAAAMRHINEVRRGKIIDPESGLPIVSHILANAIFLAYFYSKKTTIRITENMKFHDGQGRYLLNSGTELILEHLGTHKGKCDFIHLFNIPNSNEFLAHRRFRLSEESPYMFQSEDYFDDIFIYNLSQQEVDFFYPILEEKGLK